MRLALFLCVPLAGCGNKPEAPQEPAPRQIVPRTAPAVTEPKPLAISCSKTTFPMNIDLAEASGATYLPGDVPTVIVVGDSGTHGEYVQLDADTGALVSAGNLPLDKKASDDLEGLSAVNGVLYGITSSGWMRHWKVVDGGAALKFEQVEDSYPISGDDSGLISGDDSGLASCDSAHDTNCAHNYEGLCLIDKSAENRSCAGFAAAKTTGTLHCLVSDDNGRLSVDSSRSIKVAGKESLTGCHFDAQARLWFGLNTFGANQIGYVEDWQEPNPKPIRVGMIGIGFPEAIAAGPEGAIFRFSDTAGRPSLLGKYICR